MPSSTPPSSSVLLFDVNETLLDLGPLMERINEILLDGSGAKLWFATTLQYSLVMTVSEQYAPFSEIAIASLLMLARNRDVMLGEDEARGTVAAMATLAPHPDVRPGLERLRDAGFRLAALSNSSASGLGAQLEHAGLADLFEKRLSVEAVRKYKPHAAVYRWAAEQMQAGPQDCRLVAAHGWDVAGAHWAGLRNAFLARAMGVFPLAPEPDLVAGDMQALAEQLLA